MKKQLVCKSTPKTWKLILRVSDAKYEPSNCDTVIATFNRRPMGVMAMTSAVNHMRKNLMLDRILLETNQVALNELKKIGVLPSDILGKGEAA